MKLSQLPIFSWCTPSNLELTSWKLWPDAVLQLRVYTKFFNAHHKIYRKRNSTILVRWLWNILA